MTDYVHSYVSLGDREVGVEKYEKPGSFRS